MIIVVNKKTYKGSQDLPSLDGVIGIRAIHEEYIGRSNGGSLLQNDFIIGRDGNREEVIEKARINILWRMESDPKFLNYMEALAALHKHGVLLVLVCHCKPLACHGDKVKEILEAM